MCEVSTISCGEAGVQLSVLRDEKKFFVHQMMVDLDVLFEETNDDLFLVDLEPNVIDDIKNGAFANIFDPEFSLNGKQDGGNNFARGHHIVGKEIIDTVNDRIRKLVDNWDNVEGFVVNHSVGGGTGSELGVDYRKQMLTSIIIHCVVEA